MNIRIHIFLTLITLCSFLSIGQSQCNAEFEWEQIPGTLQIHFINQSTSENPPFSNLWNFGDGDMGDGLNPTHTYDEPGTYNVCLIIEDNEGCVSDVCHQVTVEAVQSDCNASFTWDQIGTTLAVHFTSTSTSEHDIVSYQWTFGDGTEGEGPNPTHTYEEPGVYLVCLIIEDNVGCVSDVCHEVLVEGEPSECNAAFEWDQVGGTLEVDFNDNSTSNHDIISWQWTFGDGGTSDDANPLHVYDEPGTYLVCLIIEDGVGCVSDVCHEVTVEGSPSDCNAAFTWDQIGGTLGIHFTSTSTSEHDIISYNWNFGDGHEGDGPNPTHTYEEPGTYLVCLIIEDNVGCVSDVCHEVVVEGVQSDCNASFVWEQIPGTLQFHFVSTSTSEHDIISYQWTFGDGGTSDNNDPLHTYDEPGVYLVCLIIEDNVGCISDVCHEVVVEGSQGCNANFEWEIIENGLGVHFFSTSTSEHDITSYHWYFGDGTEGDGQNPIHIYDEPGTYHVCLVITDSEGCVSEECHDVTVGETEGCNANFEWEIIENGLGVHFFNTSTSEHDIISFQWFFGDGTQGDGQNPIHEYDEPGTYHVCLVITDGAGCISEECHDVTVGETEGCNANFEWEIIGNGLGVHFFSNSTSEHDIISYQWFFGDGTQGDGQNPIHEYQEPGVYHVCLVITDSEGCVSEECHDVTVGETEDCNASFEWEIIEEGTGAHFFSTSTSNHDIISYQWTFGDGGTSDNNDPIHIYDEPGVYLVCLTITDNAGCVSDVCHEVVIGEPEGCNASFNFETEEGVVYFNNTSTGQTEYTTWFWAFGDGETSTDESPNHEYDEPGVYTVCLLMNDSTTNCSDEYCVMIALQLGWQELHWDESHEGLEAGPSPTLKFNEEFEIFRYTNPAADEIFIEFSTGGIPQVYIELFDLTGTRILTSLIESHNKGPKRLKIDTRDLNPGFYLISLSGGEYRITKGLYISR